MFTGLVEGVGTLRSLVPRAGGAKLTVESHEVPVGELAVGESIAVDGVCLTVTATSGPRFHADVVPETLSRTTLGERRPGWRLNLERAVRLGDRLGGHLVQGHVDTVCRVAAVRRTGADCRLAVELPESIARFVAEKGSVAVNGVSLTVAGVGQETFEIALIPETLTRTNLGAARAGTTVNVEVDLLARYLERFTGLSGGTAS